MGGKSWSIRWTPVVTRQSNTCRYFADWISASFAFRDMASTASLAASPRLGFGVSPNYASRLWE
jgi:hypothetical protein